MNRLSWPIGLLAISIIAGCHTDIVCTSRLNELEFKCVYIEPIESENPYVGRVLRDVLEKEFIRRHIEMCDADNATIFITGSTFMTLRATAVETGLVSPKTVSTNQAIESVSIKARDSEGHTLLSASYDNKEQYSASRLAKEFGGELANKLK